MRPKLPDKKTFSGTCSHNFLSRKIYDDRFFLYFMLTTREILYLRVKTIFSLLTSLKHNLLVGNFYITFSGVERGEEYYLFKISSACVISSFNLTTIIYDKERWEIILISKCFRDHPPLVKKILT